MKKLKILIGIRQVNKVIDDKDKYIIIQGQKSILYLKSQVSNIKIVDKEKSNDD